MGSIGSGGNTKGDFKVAVRQKNDGLRSPLYDGFARLWQLDVSPIRTWVVFCRGTCHFVELFKPQTISWVEMLPVLHAVHVWSHTHTYMYACMHTNTNSFRNAKLVEQWHRQCSLVCTSLMNRPFIHSFTHSMNWFVFLDQISLYHHLLSYSPMIFILVKSQMFLDHIHKFTLSHTCTPYTLHKDGIF